MSLSDHDANLVLQLSGDYLEMVVRRFLAYEMSQCLTTRGLSVEVGGQHLRTDGVTFEVTDVGLSTDDSGTTVDVTISVMNGTLEAGPEDDLQAVNSTTLSFPMTVGNRSGQANVLVVEVTLPRDRTQRFEVDLSPLAAGSVSLSLASDPARIKALSDGTVALGVSFAGSSGSDFSSFVSDYDDSELETRSDDWALVLDEWTVAQYVENIDPWSNESAVQNLDVELERIGWASGLQLEATAEFDGKEICAYANAPPRVTDWEELVFDYTVVNAELCGGDSWLNTFKNVYKKVKQKGLDEGTIEVLDSLEFGSQSDSMGRLIGREATTDAGELVIYGWGTKHAASQPIAEVEPSEVKLVVGCGSEANPRGTFTVTNAADGGPPLDLCTVELASDGEFDLSGPAVGHGNTRLDPGDSAEHEVEYTGSASDPARQTVRVVTGRGVETVTLRTFTGVGSIDAQDSLELEGEEEVEDCVCGTMTAVTGLVHVENDSSAPVQVCDVSISSTGDGRWSVEGVYRDTGPRTVTEADRLFAGDSGFVEVTYDADTLDEWRSATLTIETSGNDETVDLRARVNSPDGADVPPREAEDGCVAGLEVGGRNVCLTSEGIYVVNEMVQRVIEMLFDEYPLGDLSVWDGLTPECGPRMLCPNFLEVHLDRAPSEYVAEFVGPDGGQRYRERHAGGPATMLVPMDGEPVEMHQEVGGDVAEGEVTGHVKAWSVQRVASWETDRPLDGLDAVGGRVAALQDGTVRLFDLGERWQPSELGSLQLDVPAAGLVGVGNLLAVYGDDGMVTLRAGGDGFHRLGEAATPLSLLVPAAGHSPRRRLAYGVGPDGVSLLDLTDPGRPEVAWTADRSADGPVTTGFATGDTLLLAGNDTVSRWLVGDDRLEPAGRVDADGVVSVFGGDDTAYALSESGTARILTVTPGDEFAARGVVEFPENWKSVLPYGRPGALGGEAAVARRLDRQGFGVLRLRQGQYRPGEA